MPDDLSSLRMRRGKVPTLERIMLTAMPRNVVVLFVGLAVAAAYRK
jgi:hypothetical protein